MEPESQLSASINSTRIERTVPSRMTLATLLRDELGLTGTKVSCGLQACGVCTVLVDDKPVSSCTFLAADIDGAKVTTIEGLADGDTLHPIQEAFIKRFAFQCGFCTPGFILMAKALLDREPDPSREEIIDWFEGNICRCTGYAPILDAVEDAAAAIRNAADGGATHHEEQAR